MFLRSSDAKGLRFGLPVRFGLRCERLRCQIASDVGRAMRTTRGKLFTYSWNTFAYSQASLLTVS